MITFRSPARSAARPSRALTTMILASGALLAMAAAAACSGDDSTTAAFIGTTDAEPPRLGTRDADAGASLAR